MRHRSIPRLALRSFLTLSLAVPLVAGCASPKVGGVRLAEGKAMRAQQPDNIAHRAAASVGIVTTDVGRGMAFVIDPDGYMLTNRHVIEDADHIEAVSFPALDPPLRIEAVQIVYIDPERDLALIKLETDKQLPHLTLATDRPVPVSDYIADRDAVMLMSLDRATEDAEHPEGLVAHLGEVKRLEVYNPNVGPGPFIGLSAGVRQGQSGGPVLDRYGRVVGVVTWTWRDRKGGFAIPISESTRMLKERPELGDEDAHRERVKDRAEGFMAAIRKGDVGRTRRVTSPSYARRLRSLTVEVLMEQIGGEGGGLDHFIGAIAEIADKAAASEANPFPAFEELAAQTGSSEFHEALGVRGRVPPGAVVTFFHELGQAYLAARYYGNLDHQASVEIAFQRLFSLDAARTFALVNIDTRLEKGDYDIESVEIVPGQFRPRAVVTVKVGEGAKAKRWAMQMSLEWGDWYVAEIQGR